MSDSVQQHLENEQHHYFPYTIDQLTPYAKYVSDSGETCRWYEGSFEVYNNGTWYSQDPAFHAKTRFCLYDDYPVVVQQVGFEQF